MMLLLASLPTVIGAAAVLPALMLLWLVVATDRRPEPPGLVGIAFLLGVAALFLTPYLVAPLHPLVALANRPWPSVIARAIFVAAIPEESAKVALIALLVMRLRAAHEPMDGLVYGAAVGLGFAAWENLGYLAGNADDWQVVAIARNVLTVPFHGALGIIAGAYLGAARFSGDLGAHRHGGSFRLRQIALAWLVPVALHAAFDIATLALLRRAAGNQAVEHLLQVSALLIGFGTMALAVLLALRLAAHQKALPGAYRVTVAGWRGVWALLVVGAAAGFAGAALLASQALLAWQTSAAPQLFPVATGAALLAAAAVFLHWSRRRLVARLG
jgi:RsiW-degrading membrane proteinase PrsW (M82 family)